MTDGGPYITTVNVNSPTGNDGLQQSTSTTQPAVSTSQNSEVGKPTQSTTEKIKPGQPRGGTKHGDGNGYNITFSSSSGLQDLESIRKMLNESLQGGQESIDQLSRKVQELIEGKQKDTQMIQQLEDKTNELTRMLKEEKEANANHRTSQAQKELETKDKQITELRQETTELKQETEKLRQEVEKLRTSLSKAAAEKLTDNNPSITDLSDPNRPQKLLEKFNSLYDNLWTDAFEHVSKNEVSEKRAAENLVDILKQCWEFCRTCADRQLEDLQKKLIRPEEIREEAIRPGLTQTLSAKELKLIKDTRKAVATHTLTSLKQFYWKTKAKQPEKLRPYVDACIEICWYAAVNDPKLDFGFDPKKNKDDFREYTQTGQYIDYLVWPAMYLHVNGPLLYKGVVQMRSNQSEKEREQM